MKLSRQAILASDGQTAQLCAFISYVDGNAPVLLHRIGRIIADDMHDDFCDSISLDNGRTWSKPQLQPFSSARPEGDGYVIHTENSALYLPGKDTLFHFTNDRLEKNLSEID